MSKSVETVTHWVKALTTEELPVEGRVLMTTVGTTTICITHYEEVYSALDNRCPHQGGPLGGRVN